MKIKFTVCLMILFALFQTFQISAQNLIHQFDFNNDFTDTQGTSIVLTPTGTFTSSGFSGGDWSWSTSGGSDNTGAGLILETDELTNPQNYSLGFRISFNDIGPSIGYKKILGFLGAAVDKGLYFYYEKIFLWPDGGTSANSFSANTFYDFIITRKQDAGGNDVVKVYTVAPDGTLTKVYEYADASDNTVPILVSGKYQFIFFRDDTGHPNEYTSGGIVSQIRLWDVPIDDAVWTGNVSTDWNTPGNWSINVVPISATNVIIPTIPTGNRFPETNTASNKTAEANNLTIQTSAHIYIPQGNALTVYGNLTRTGDLKLFSTSSGLGSASASLITYGTVTGTGVFEYQQYISKKKWHYIGSPIATYATANFFQPNFYFYNEATNDYWNEDLFTNNIMGWSPPSETNMVVTKGYICYEPEDKLVSFTGAPNTGNKNFTLSYTNNTATHSNAVFDGWNLIANPYPSYIDWNSSLISKTRIDNAIYFYVDDGDGKFNNYSYYVSAGGSPYPSIAVNAASNYIAPAQAFFVKAKSTSNATTFTFQNKSRCHSSTEFFKNNSETNEQNEVIRLKISNSNSEDETAIRFLEPASEQFDSQFDAYKLFPNSSYTPQIFSITENTDNNLAVNSLPILTDSVTSIKIGVKTSSAEQHVIRIENLLTNDSVSVYFEDMYLNELQKIESILNYNFTNNLETNLNTNRFRLIFKKNKTVFDQNIPEFEIYSYQNNVVINTNDLYSKKVNVNIYNILGQNIKSALYFNQNNINIQLNNSTGNYIIEAISNNEIYRKQVFISN